jgi:hypothetical protein
MGAKSNVPDRVRIDLVIFRIKEVESSPGASECIRTSQSNIHTECLPAVNDGRTNVNTFNSAGREEKVAQKCIERSDKPGMAERAGQTERMTTRDEFFDRRVCKRQDGKAATHRQGWRDARNPRHNRARLSCTRARLDEGPRDVVYKSPLLVR